MTEAPLVGLEAALAIGDLTVIVRSPGAIAEVAGGPLRVGPEWLTIGAEEAGASHVHIRRSDVTALRFQRAQGRNAALDALGPDGAVVVSLSFRKTNPERPESFDAGRLAAIVARFQHLGGVEA